jgi:DNA polymerase elongation subunit (family B)
MNIFRNDRKLKLSNKGKFIFQSLEWTGYDKCDDEENSDCSSDEEVDYEQRYKDGRYLIRIYGVTAKSNSVCLSIDDFTPYFFVKIPQYWKNDEIRRLVNYVKFSIAAKYKGSIKSADIVERKEFYGFTNNKKFKFVRFVFQSQGCMRAVARVFQQPLRIASISSKPLFLKLYESNIDPFIRFIHCQDLNPSGWIELHANKFEVVNYKETTCQIELKAKWSNVFPHDKQDIAPLVIASFDIECTSVDGSFPKSDRLGDKVIQIGTTVHRFGEKECFLKHMITLGDCDPIDGIMVESYQTEAEVLIAWKNFINRLDPDIITGYNIWGFDLRYMYERAKLLEVQNKFSQISRLRGKVGKLIEKQLQSSALGQNFLYILETEGRVQIDLMKLVQKDHKLDMYKLDFVASHFLKSNKVDLSPKELFKKFREGTPSSIRDIAVYCVQDCELCNRLIDKLDVITGNIGMSNVCFVPFSWLFTRGQGVKIFSLVAKQCRKEGFVIKVVRKEEDDGSYEGAIVLVAKPGIYLKPISVTDYASLYPSSMISENISHDSAVWIKVLDTNGKILSEWGNPEYYNLPDFNYNIIEYDNFEGVGDKKEITGKTVCCFAEHKDGTKNAVPRILESLLFARRQTRASIKYKDVYLNDGIKTCGDVSEKDGKVYVTKYKEKPEIFAKSEVKEIKQKFNSFQQSVLDGLQLAYKITANSLYGQIGAKTSPICFKELAACTTATGRSLLRFAKDHTEKMYPGAKCVYGDSVTGDTPLLLKDKNNNIQIRTIESLGDEWIPYNEFKSEQSNRKEKQQSSCNYKIWVKDHWATINRVIRHKTLKKMYRVNTHQGVIDVTEDHSLVNIDGEKIKTDDCIIDKTLLLHGFPTEFNEKNEIKIEDVILIANKLKNSNCDSESELNKIINSKHSIRKKFLETYLDLNNINIKIKSKIIAQHLYYLLKSLKYDINIDVTGNTYIIQNSQYSNPCVVKKIIPLGYNDESSFVYDIETSSGKFNGGVGQICVSNTDSVFIDFTKYISDVLGLNLKGKDALQKSIELGIKSGEEVTKHLKKPHDLEYEKTFYPFVQLAKKRYVGNLYGTSTEKFYQNSMGIVLKRRDNAQICKKIYGGIIDIILNQQDVPKALKFFVDSVKELLEGKEDIQNLVITKTLRAEYKSPQSIAHKVLADRMAERDPGNKPQSNDRIPFVYIQTKEIKGVKLLQGDKVEHPEYIKQHPSIKPDFRYYLDHQIKVPCIQLFALVLEQLPGYNASWFDESIIRKLKEKGKSQKEIDDKISDHREKEAEKLIIGDILRIDTNRRSGNSMITDFFVKRNKDDDMTFDDCFDNLRNQWQDIKAKKSDNKTLLKVRRKQKAVNLDEIKAEVEQKNQKEDKLSEQIIQPSKDVLRRVAQIRERKKQEKKEEREKKKADNEKKPRRQRKTNIKEV